MARVAECGSLTREHLLMGLGVCTNPVFPLLDCRFLFGESLCRTSSGSIDLLFDCILDLPKSISIASFHNILASRRYLCTIRKRRNSLMDHSFPCSKCRRDGRRLLVHVLSSRGHVKHVIDFHSNIKELSILVRLQVARTPAEFCCYRNGGVRDDCMRDF